MAWIESHTILLRHRKLIGLAKDLDLKPVYVLGHLTALWHSALEQQEDGDLSTWSAETIAEMSAFDGDPDKYLELLQLHKFLDDHILHDWLDYAGKYLTAKYRTSNPKKLKQINAVHKSVFSRSKVRKKSTQDAIGLSEVIKSPKEGDARGKISDIAFEKFYSAYPRKVAKSAAQKAWKKEAIYFTDVQDKIMEALERQKKQPQWLKDDGQFIPYPATWLNQRRWEDAPIVKAVSPTKLIPKPISTEARPSDEEIQRGREFLRDTVTSLAKKMGA